MLVLITKKNRAIEHSNYYFANTTQGRLKPGSHLCDKHNTSDISISTRKKEHVPFFLCLCLCLSQKCEPGLKIASTFTRMVQLSQKLSLILNQGFYCTKALYSRLTRGGRLAYGECRDLLHFLNVLFIRKVNFEKQ